VTTQLGVTDGYLALRRGVAAFPAERDVLAVTGADAVTFLQGQLSADVVALGVGESTCSLLLQPQGKVEAWIRLTRTAEDRVVVDVDGGWGDAVAARLNRFKLRVDATIEALDWTGVSLRGPDAPGVDVAASGAELVLPVDWRGLAGVDLLGPHVSVPDGVDVADPLAAHNVRIEQGWPAMGHELDDSVIPAEVGQWLIDTSVSFTKGCYTGQELVARIDSRGGNVPRPVRLLVVEGEFPVAPGAEVRLDGQPVGSVSSSTPPLSAGHPGLALAPLARAVEPGATVEVETIEGWMAAGVVEPPFVGHGSH
jgi:folate-binding protein YgfZ